MARVSWEHAYEAYVKEVNRIDEKLGYDTQKISLEEFKNEAKNYKGGKMSIARQLAENQTIRDAYNIYEREYDRLREVFNVPEPRDEKMSRDEFAENTEEVAAEGITPDPKIMAEEAVFRFSNEEAQKIAAKAGELGFGQKDVLEIRKNTGGKSDKLLENMYDTYKKQEIERFKAIPENAKLTDKEIVRKYKIGVSWEKEYGSYIFGS